MNLTQFNAEQLAILAAVIAGITELITRVRAKDFWVVATIVTSALVGGLLAVYYHLDFVTGVVAGFGASGAIKFVGSVGNRSVPTKSEVIVK